MGLRSFLRLLQETRAELRGMKSELDDANQGLLSIPQASPGAGAAIARGGSAGGGGGGGGSAGGGNTLSGVEVLQPGLGTSGPARTIDELEATCNRTTFTLRNAATGLPEPVEVWSCPDRAVYLVPVDPPTISARSSGGSTGGGGGRGAPSPRNNVGQGVDRFLPGADPASAGGGLSTAPVAQGLKAVKDSVEGLRQDLRRADGGTIARARGDL